MYSDLSVFDLDHTLLKVNCSFRFGFYLYKQNFFSSFKLLSCLAYYIRHKFLGLSICRLHEKVFDNLFKCRKIEDIHRYVQLFLDKEFDSMLYDPTIKRLKKAQSLGHHTLILSSSPDFLVQPIAIRLGVSDWKSSLYESDEAGRLIRISKILEGQGKANYIEEWIGKFQAYSISITAYSDSYLDLPILKIAQKAIGVLPDRRLRKICLKNGWEIL